MKITIIRPAELPEERELDAKTDPGLGDLSALLNPILDLDGPCAFEHVTVLHDGERRDMFIDEMSRRKGLDRNEAATAIYRNAWLTRHPTADPESLEAIYGPAVLFLDAQVWR